MATIAPHGGRCCGINHMWNFSGTETKSQIETLLKRTRQGRVRGQLIEAVLTEKQLRKNPHLRMLLQDELGFVEVCNFVNINSGNRCHVFHYHKNLTHFKA